MTDPRDPALHHYESENAARWREQSEIDQMNKQTALLEQIRNAVFLIAVVVFLFGAFLLLGLLAANAS